MLDPSDPFKVVTVLDWEMATLGDPLMDLGNALAYWFQIDDSEEMQQMAIQPSNVKGMMTRAEILAYYSEQTGFDTSHFDYYMVFGYFRLAGIMQQIYYRYFHKQTQDERFAIYGYAATMMCKHCQKLIAASSL
jgi:aminoglycoside phosphotransferase (APT) family kinase protein